MHLRGFYYPGLGVSQKAGRSIRQKAKATTGPRYRLREPFGDVMVLFLSRAFSRLVPSIRQHFGAFEYVALVALPGRTAAPHSPSSAAAHLRVTLPLARQPSIAVLSATW